ncbi:TIGR03915 family putative DNA repair protein [Flavobacterium sp.]|uniref:TIGR03915 family putative DNA repair protein n=1 Tax=Flavobacterium sp. TaxID=239 RepID=UPI0012170F2F|nr:TIGR03915 family putative DNA repair protein [Flavobacterium sp.]RZJ73786.1 MAG: DNA metabolism protein [Flavobacterium sp.]
MTTFVFDGSLEGLLTAVFEFYELKPKAVKLESAIHFQPGFLDEVHEVVSDETKSKRVWDGFKKKVSADWQRKFYYAYLSERPENFRLLFDFARYVFDNPKGVETNFGHPAVMALTKIEKSVSRERHRMKAFIRFQETSDGIFYAPIEPDFNVLPLISNFFKNRYADQRWIIYDLKRKYGLFYDLETVSEITFDVVSELQQNSTFLPAHTLNGKEELYGLLWNDYFKSTNIEARKNMKLHIQHVPKRYWKYLTEKKQQ